LWQAVLWDLDGTLVDTEPVWMAAEQELAAEHGVEWTHADGLALVGLALPDSGAYIKERLGSPVSSAEIVDYLVERVAGQLAQQVPWRPGALDLVAAFAEADVPQALVTMSYAPIATAVAQHLPFAAVVTGDAVVMGSSLAVSDVDVRTSVVGNADSSGPQPFLSWRSRLPSHPPEDHPRPAISGRR
jgi:beta-phosphoglucomutase-like phosphatase (HAD superfamily)